MSSGPPYPVRLQLLSDGTLRIGWNDGQVRRYDAEALYSINPAADAKEERQKPKQEDPLTVIDIAETQPRRVVNVLPVGNYAFAIHFNYGSNAGVYRFELLHEHGEPEQEEG